MGSQGRECKSMTFVSYRYPQIHCLNVLCGTAVLMVCLNAFMYTFNLCSSVQREPVDGVLFCVIPYTTTQLSCVTVTPPI